MPTGLDHNDTSLSLRPPNALIQPCSPVRQSLRSPGDWRRLRGRPYTSLPSHGWGKLMVMYTQAANISLSLAGGQWSCGRRVVDTPSQRQWGRHYVIEEELEEVYCTFLYTGLGLSQSPHVWTVLDVLCMFLWLGSVLTDSVASLFVECLTSLCRDLIKIVCVRHKLCQHVNSWPTTVSSLSRLSICILAKYSNLR